MGGWSEGGGGDAAASAMNSFNVESISVRRSRAVRRGTGSIDDHNDGQRAFLTLRSSRGR